MREISWDRQYPVEVEAVLGIPVLYGQGPESRRMVEDDHWFVFSFHSNVMNTNNMAIHDVMISCLSSDEMEGVELKPEPDGMRGSSFSLV